MGEEEEDCKLCKKWKEQCRRFEEHFYWDHVDVRRMHFLKIMTGDLLDSMIIPKKFIESFHGELLETVELKVPSGNIWHVGLRKTNDGVALEYGWRNFIKDHDIQENDTLVFKYDGDSSFIVLMFDQSGCEKATAYCPKRRYPVFDLCKTPEKSSKHRANGKAPSCSFDNETLKAGKNAEVKYVRLGSISQKTSKHKKQLALSNNKGTLNEQESMTTEGTETQSNEVYLDNQFTSKSIIISRKTHLSDEEKSRVLSFAGSIQTDKPCFVSFMVPTSILRRFYMSIPMAFADEFLPQTSQIALLLLPEKTRSWSVHLLVQKSSVGLSSGWKEFAGDNNLKLGDFCLFELLDIQNGITIVVHINRSLSLELIPN